MAANSFQTNGDWIAMESLRLLTNKIEIPKYFDTSYSKEFKKPFAVGESIQIKLKQQWLVREDTFGYSPQAIDRRTQTVTMDQVVGLDFDYDTIDEALRMERSKAEISEQYLEPAMQQIKQKIEDKCAYFAYVNSPNVVGALGTDPTTMVVFGAARQRLFEGGGLSGKKGVVIAPSVNTSMVDAMKGLMQSASELKKQYEEGTMGRYQGFDWTESNATYTHTAGTWAGAVTLTTTPVTGATTLSLTATTGDTFKKGDKVGVAGSYRVHPMTRRITTRAQTAQYTILENVTAAASAATVSIYPAIEGPGSQYQNVDVIPVATAALTLWPGTSSPNGKVGHANLALTDGAFAMVSVPLMMPTKAEIASQKTDPESGISIAFIRDWDTKERKMMNRFDCLFGFGRLHAAASSVVIASA